MKINQDTMRLHISMLNDRPRTSSFIDAINQVVRPNDVVVDIGTGTGILAMAAARAGARHVYAIEAGKIGKLAQQLFADNGLADHITLIKGWSTEIDLPELADVLVSEVIGHEPLAEDVLQVMGDAAKRLLKADARLIPNRLKIFCLPVTIPTAEYKKLVFTAQATQDWQSWYGVDFAALADVNQDMLFRFLMTPDTLRSWKPISPALKVADIDFSAAEMSAVETTRTGTSNRRGQMNGIVVYFELTLGQNIVFSTSPNLIRDQNHWNNPVWVLSSPYSLRAGIPFRIHFSYDPDQHFAQCEVELIQ